MTLSTLIEIIILTFSSLLFVTHMYLVFFQNKIKKMLKNKKLSQEKREEEQKKLQALTKMLMEDNNLSSKFKNYISQIESETKESNDTESLGFKNKL